MKTLSFHDLEVGRPQQPGLLKLDTEGDGLRITSGINLIVAPNGRGKTSLLQTLGGILTATRGGVSLEGAPLDPEQSVLYISEYLNFPKFIKASEWIEFMARRTLSPEAKAGLQPWIEGFSLKPKMESYLGRMSQGERRKVTWLGAEASGSPVLLLDEPLDGLDLLAIETARKMLARWKAQGRIICVVAHQTGEILDMSDEVFLIRDQKLVRWRTYAPKAAHETPVEEFRDRVLEFYQPKT